MYPATIRRTPANLRLQKVLAAYLTKLLEWRKTFAPQTTDVGETLWSDPRLLDQLYCNDLLASVPGFVERTLQLHNMTLTKGDTVAHVYLRQAASCYIFGLPEATIAMSRSALEAGLRARTAGIYGEGHVGVMPLKELISVADRARLLPTGTLPLAEKVRQGGNDVLHGKEASLQTALGVFTACKSVLVRLFQGPPGHGTPPAAGR